MGILDNIDWDKLWEIIEKLIALCQSASEDAVVNEVRNPGLVTRRRFERAVRRGGLSLTGEQFAEVYQMAATASQLTLQQVVRDAWSMF